ncbi:OmpA family protein [Ideonella alba]|uniref:OmpA family protein n=1 Tax=Ideonella alba TaxID=2824118 RepID=UPI0021130310|nr:OmpA family protein [Ideonella alba]
MTSGAGGSAVSTITTAARPLQAPIVAAAPVPVQPQDQAQRPGRAARRLERAVVIFPSDSANVGDLAKARLAELSVLLKQAARVRIVGYTDDIGDQALNDKLALARALAVASQLRQLLGQASQTPLIPSGRGLCCYLVANQSWGARAANRRVELLIELEDTPGNAWLIDRHQPLLAGPAMVRFPSAGGARAAS